MTSRSSWDLIVREAGEITTETDADMVLDVLEKMTFVAQEARKRKKLLEEAIIEWIQENGRLGNYYVGTGKRYKVRDPLAAAEAILEATGGDLEEFVAYLSANPWKPGSVRSRLGAPRFDAVFETIEDPELRLLRRRPKELK